MTLLTLDQVVGLPVEQVGGKAKGLAQLARLGLPVPPARVLDASAHADFVRSGRLADDVAEALAAAAAELGSPLAVRSSAADEDVDDKSAAGQYESVMGVVGADALRAAVEQCFRAAESERARAYRGDSVAGVALVIQEEAAARRAGVAFSVDPLSGSPDAVVIEAAFGHGEGVVSGAVTPDRYLVRRDDGRVLARVADKQRWSDGRGVLHDLPRERSLARVMRDDEARRIAGLVDIAAEGFGVPVDVEFCWSGPQLWMVQCRPITTLARHG